VKYMNPLQRQNVLFAKCLKQKRNCYVKLVSILTTKCVFMKAIKASPYLY